MSNDKIKKLFILIGLFFLAMPVRAQEASPTDEIVVKSTDAVMFQMKANLRMTQDQIDAIRPMVADYIAKERTLQLKLEAGDIDGKTMYNERQQLTNDEYQQFSTILTSDQLKLWINIQQNQD